MKELIILFSAISFAFGNTEISKDQLILEEIEGLIFKYAGIEKKKTVVETKTTIESLGKGKDKVEQTRLQNKAKITKMQAIEKSKEGKDWIEQKKIEEQQFIEAKLKQMQNYYSKWLEEKKKFHARITQYEKGLAEIPTAKFKIIKTKLKSIKEVNLDKKLIPTAFELSVKDQGERPTCSAFAAVRAIEIMEGSKKDFSEQYFYFASKPKCQNKKCSSRGSWVGIGIEGSVESQRPNIPLESDCPYKRFNKDNNETQIPLSPSCSKGSIKISDFKYVTTFDEVVEALDKNKVVIIGTSLDSRYFRNNGLVFEGIKAKKVIKTKHSNGHAYPLVGYIKLPKKLHAKEGRACFLTTNSWGEGWGLGGHACISEKWLIRNSKKSPIVIISSIE